MSETRYSSSVVIDGANKVHTTAASHFKMHDSGSSAHRATDKAANVDRPGVDQADIPEFLDRICKQHSVSFTKEDTLRQKQAFPFMSEEWDEFHDHARQSIESLHSGFKDAGKEGVESSGRRRVRGFAAGRSW
ncbi:hypothetical protein F1C58_06445 [Glaciihabitans sp. INWT7]|uniref:hypothetical protein n=1 Tax=Glaciihabitans sp. INWT7 TaxID=2596912 RepID=UPI00162ABEA0|nr:hypothetical protein [Glaciihabitans sp. INWT7]QNE46581.1 hypothetical protein F1C58_06445 [Glaciihabitans sp. INWT7]